MAQQENAPNKPVHLMYICGAALLFFVMQWTIDWLWGYFERYLGPAPSESKISMFSGVATLVVAWVTYRSDRVYTLANEVTSELKKVTWPTGKEVRSATFVVIIMAIISAIILGLFDFVWSNVTELVYG